MEDLTLPLSFLENMEMEMLMLPPSFIDETEEQPVVKRPRPRRGARAEVDRLMKENAELTAKIEYYLAEYNSMSKQPMPLVLFLFAVEHICRITRTIDKPRGNCLLVGVGGSGKQSLSRLSSFICGCDVFQITVPSSFGVNDL